MPRYARDYDRAFARRPSPGPWRRGPEQAGLDRRRYDADPYRRYAREAGGWPHGYDRDHPHPRGATGPYGAGGYGRGDDARPRPLHPNEPLARALREEAEELIADYLREERYGAEYARSIGLRTHGRGDRLRRLARRLSRRGYDRSW